MTLQTALRTTVATFAVPIAISASIGQDDYRTPWRAKSVHFDSRTSTAIDSAPVIRLGANLAPTSSAATSENVVLTEAAASALELEFAGARPAVDETVAWITAPLAQIAELARSPVTELPEEKPIRRASIAAAAQVLLDVSSAGGPQPQIVPRGDGGLQVIWYASVRDLEIEVSPVGGLEIIEFDGEGTRRIAYDSEAAADALGRLADALKA